MTAPVIVGVDGGPSAEDALVLARWAARTLEAPLVLPPGAAVRLQVRVGPPGPDGGRTLAVHSRAEDVPGSSWTRHATGSVAEHARPATAGPESWPPPGATAVAVGDLYDGFAGSGYEYGPAFRGVRAAWRCGAEVFTEVIVAPDYEDGALEALTKKKNVRVLRCPDGPAHPVDVKPIDGGALLQVADRLQAEGDPQRGRLP